MPSQLTWSGELVETWSEDASSSSRTMVDTSSKAAQTTRRKTFINSFQHHDTPTLHFFTLLFFTLLVESMNCLCQWNEMSYVINYELIVLELQPVVMICCNQSFSLLLKLMLSLSSSSCWQDWPHPSCCHQWPQSAWWTLQCDRGLAWWWRPGYGSWLYLKFESISHFRFLSSLMCQTKPHQFTIVLRWQKGHFYWSTV